MSSFLTRAGAVKDHSMRLQENNLILKELARDPGLRDLGWVISKKPLTKFNQNALSIGSWYSNTQMQLDKSILSKTDRALRRLGWNRSATDERRKWGYQKSLSEVSIKLDLTWRLGSPVYTDDHALGRQQYPIKYMEIVVDDGYIN